MAIKRLRGLRNGERFGFRRIDAITCLSQELLDEVVGAGRAQGRRPGSEDGDSGVSVADLQPLAGRSWGGDRQPLRARAVGAGARRADSGSAPRPACLPVVAGSTVLATRPR